LVKRRQLQAGEKMNSDTQTIGEREAVIAPMLSVRNGSKAIEFYKAAFGAAELFRIDGEGGAVVAQLSLGKSQFWVADESPEHLNFSPESLGGGTVRMVLTVEDPDETFEKAVTAGATVVSPVADQAYGWRVGRIVDPFGHHWEIGRPIGQ
jgi:PhnB protein